jgi:hypothetical protein
MSVNFQVNRGTLIHLAAALGAVGLFPRNEIHDGSHIIAFDANPERPGAFLFVLDPDGGSIVVRDIDGDRAVVKGHDNGTVYLYGEEGDLLATVDLYDSRVSVVAGSFVTSSWRNPAAIRAANLAEADIRRSVEDARRADALRWAGLEEEYELVKLGLEAIESDAVEASNRYG